jgi:hypothetical protein
MLLLTLSAWTTCWALFAMAPRHADPSLADASLGQRATQVPLQ